MKKYFYSLVFLFFGLGVHAQNYIPFQGQAFGANGKGLNKTLIGVKVSILTNSDDNSMVYAERDTVTTDENGLFQLNIGGGSQLSNDGFSAIDWSGMGHYFKVEMDITGGENYQLVSKTKMGVVPFALYSKDDSLRKRVSDMEDKINTILERLGDTLDNYENTLSEGLVAYYPFNGNANDESGNGYDAINYGANSVNDRFNNENSAFEFASDGVIRTDKVIPDVTNTFSISVWALTRNTAPSMNQGYRSSNNADADGPPIVHPTHGQSWDNISAGLGIIFGTNQISLIEHSHGYIYYPLTYTGSFTEWTHLVVVYENKIPKLYLNGNLVKTGLVSESQLLRPSICSDFFAEYNKSGFGKSFFDSRAYNSTRQFNGIIDDYGVWNRVLTDSEIKYLYENSFNPN